MAKIENFETATFPDEAENPAKKKEEAWLLQYARAALNSYNSLGDRTIGYKSRKSYDEVKAYAFGRQDTTPYKKVLSPGDDPAQNRMVVNWSVLPIIPKFRRTAVGLVQKGQDYKITIDPIDALAKNEIQDEINTIRGKILMRKALEMQQMQEMGQVPELQQMPGEPEDLDGVEVMETGIRHKTAMEAEQVVELVFSQNNYEYIRKLCIESQFDYGISIVKDYEEGERVKIRFCDPRRIIMNYCHQPDFSDLRYIAEMVSVPVSKLEAITQGQISKEDLKTLHHQAQSGTSPISKYFSQERTFTQWWEKGTVMYMDLEIKSIDHIPIEERINKRGNLKYGKTKPGKATKIKKVENIYQVKWIVGTDICFDYGVKRRLKRDPKDRSCVKFSYHIEASDISDMVAYSRTESLMPYADAIQLAWYKLQHALNSAVPKGVAIDLHALEEVSLSAGGQKMTPKQLIDLYLQRGIMIFRSRGATGGNQSSKWIEELQGGVGNEIAEYNNLINTYLEMIRQTLGLNELTDASTPNPKMLTTIANLAASGTSNALSDMFDSDQRTSQSVAESIIIRAQNLIKDGKGQAFIDSLGHGTTTLLKSTPSIDRYVYGVSIEAKPDADSIQSLEQALRVALEREQISIDDYIRVKNIKNIKQAEMMLAYSVRKNKEVAMQESMALQEQNAKVQQEAALSAEDAKQKTLELEYRLKSELSAQLNKEKLQQIAAQGQLRLEGERIAASGRVESSYVQAKERQESNVRNNTTKLLNENMDSKADVINVKDELKSTVAPFTSEDDPQLDIEIPEEFSFIPENEGEEDGVV